MADFEQGPTERCSVCKTEYPKCHTCSKYGSRNMHPLDTEKAKGAHDNSSFIDDSGNTQSHWKNKSEKGKSKQLIPFSSLQISMWFTKAFLFYLLGTNTCLYLGKIHNPANDPFSPPVGSLSTDQFESNLFCRCVCTRRPEK